MHKRCIISLILISLLTGSCTPATSSPTVTQAIAQSATPLPTETSIPSATPYPPLQTNGLYILTEWRSVLTIMDTDGSGRKEIQLPNDGYTIELENSISPDGDLLAYFTGSTDEPYNLALNLLNLSDETLQAIANLIAPGFPQNLRPVAESLRLSDYGSQCTNIECLAVLSSYDFKLGITSFAWSPDSQYLAFAAQIDGPSSDIYVYDRKNQGIRRLTDEIENIWQMKWSPSGGKILYQASVPGPVDPYIYWYVADPKIHSLQMSRADITYPYSAKLGWIAKNSFLYALWPQGNLPDSPKYGSVRYINLENGEIKEIWPYGVESIALDPTNSKVILSTKGIVNSEINAGTYLVSLDGSFTKLSDTTYIFFEDQEPFGAFFGLDSLNQMYSISLERDIKLLGPSMEYAVPSISPNKKWILLREKNNQITLYSDDLQFLNSWSFDEYIYGNGIMWQPDSLGILISTPSRKYYLSIPNGTPNLLNTFSGGFIWLP